MRTKLSVIIILSLLSAKTAFAEMELFVSDNCPHCNKLQQEIIAGEFDRKFKIQIYEIYNDAENRDYYIYKARQLDYQNAQVPLLIDGGIYKEGTSAILEYLENKEPANDEADSLSGLNENDSKRLNELIKAHVEKPLTEAVPPVLKSTPPVESDLVKINDDSQKTKIFGLIVIIFGLTLFCTIIGRARAAARRPKASERRLTGAKKKKTYSN